MDTLGYKAVNGVRAVKRWVVPYVRSRLHPAEFRPVLCYMYVEWRCNIDCHYCFQFDNTKANMDLATAKSAIDWLHSLGCRVIPLMGGEPILRPEFILEVIRYGASQGFFMYLPTNGYLLNRELIDELGRAGVAAVNLALDCVAPRPGLPKALLAVEDQFRYLVEAKNKYGFLLFLNINICSTNLKDVKLLTELARHHRIGTDYHLNERPQAVADVSFYRHAERGQKLYVQEDQVAVVDELLDWLCDKQRQGWPMVNSTRHLQKFKDQMRGDMEPWDCRAGINGAMIRPDGSIDPCFGMLSNHEVDWGRIWEPKFDRGQLAEMKKTCLPKCSSTCFYTMASYYNDWTIPEWVRKHVQVG
jgi:MoaA/NifB/PqqE/SkfB family radical SAM enzyme